MFKPFPMVRIRVVLLKDDERAVLLSLGRQGVLHLTKTVAGQDTAPFVPCDVKPELDRCSKLLERCGQLEHLLAQFGVRRQAEALQNLAPLNEIEAALHALEEQAARQIDHRQRLLAHKKELDAACDQMSGFRDLGVTLDHLDRFSFLHFVMGSLPAGQFKINEDMLGGSAVLHSLPGNKGRQFFLIMTTPQHRQILEDRLHQMNFRQEPFPSFEGMTAEAQYLGRNNERQQVEKELQATEAEMQAFALETGPQLAALCGQISTERQLIEAQQNLPGTQTTLLLTGWTPADIVLALKKDLEEITKGRCVVVINQPDGSPGEQVPVLLHHSGWLHPFQKMVAAFGLPEYHELEPTFFMALSYIFMFGMMFGDAGQGAILVIAGMIALFSSRAVTLRDTGRILVAAGLFSTIFGVLYGSYFGIPNLKRYALWRDPLEGDPLNVMTVAISVGVVVISMGLILNVINQFRRKEVLEGVLGRFGITGIIFYWGALALLTQYDRLQSRRLLGLAVIFFLVLPLLGWIIKSPLNVLLTRGVRPSGEGDSLWVVFAESMVSALEGLILYLANTTSFVRLAAYAMSHAALLMAAFSIAATLKDSIPGGSYWGLTVIILGNLVALILEGVIVAVQAFRLEYYEFFGKFFSGQGQPFSPFSLKGIEKGVL